ncbi:MAG TPA: hypothetical protein VJA46_05765 [Acidimicrobiia bacterium]|nr:hypothetical protein [Acidimicrobiia bacterium]
MVRTRSAAGVTGCRIDPIDDILSREAIVRIAHELRHVQWA